MFNYYPKTWSDIDGICKRRASELIRVKVKKQEKKVKKILTPMASFVIIIEHVTYRCFARLSNAALCGCGGIGRRARLRI